MRWRIASINDLPIKDASANITGSSVDAPITIHHSATWAFRGDTQSGHAKINARRTNTTAEVSSSTKVNLAIRTSWIFRRVGGRWRQTHHHGSVDDPQLLSAYQQAVR
jgi:ketosteroid isomerase-like protein